MFSSVNCCSSSSTPGWKCNYWNYNWGKSGSLLHILKNWGVDNYGESAALSTSKVRTEINAGRPFVIRWGYKTSGGHFVVGEGIQGSDLYYSDPWYGEGKKIASYNWVKSNSEKDWTHTNVVTTNPGPGPNPDPDPVKQLNNGQSVSVSGNKSDWKYYFIDVPSGSTDLVMKVTGGSGDSDMYTRFGSKPTSSSWDCRPYKPGNAEECTVASPNKGKYYIGLYAYSSFSGASLTASYKDGGNPPPPPPPNNNSCEGNCGGKAPGGCWCDSSCANYGDCCSDKNQFCP